MAVLIGLAWSSAHADGEPSTCEELMGARRVAQTVEALKRSPRVDLTRARWLTGALADESVSRLDARYGAASHRLLIAAVELPRGAPLVELACALGRSLDLGKHDVLIVVNRVGMHAYAPALGYRHLRRLARRHNGALARRPAAAVVGLGTDVLEAAEAQSAERDRLGVMGLGFLLAGLVSLAVLGFVRRSRPGSMDQAL